MTDSKEITVVKAQITKAMALANSLVIEDADGLARASKLLLDVKKVGTYITTVMNAPIKRAYQAYKDIKADQEKVFGRYVEDYEQAEKVVKTKIVVYQTEVERKRLEEEKRILADKRTTAETKIQKMAEIVPAEKVTKLDQGTVSFRVDKVAVVEDKSKLPLEYLVPDMVAINKAVREGKQIPGVKVEERKIVVAR